jgi:hypothetical protein
MCVQRDVALSLDSAPRREFQEWPRHAEVVEPEIAPRKRIEAWQFEQRLRANPYANGSGALKLRFEIREELTQRVEAASEQNMNLPGLGCATSRDRHRRKRVTFQHRDGFEGRRQGFRGGEPAYAGPDNDCVPADRFWHVPCLSNCVEHSLAINLSGRGQAVLD